MASNTTRLGLLKKDPVVDGNDTFNIKTMLNDNWDAIDANVETITGAQAKADAAKAAAISAAATDATSKAATAEANAKAASIPLSQKGVANGVATLDSGAKVPLTMQTSFISRGSTTFSGTSNGTIGEVFTKTIPLGVNANLVMAKFNIANNTFGGPSFFVGKSNSETGYEGTGYASLVEVSGGFTMQLNDFYISGSNLIFAIRRYANEGSVENFNIYISWVVIG